MHSDDQKVLQAMQAMRNINHEGQVPCMQEMFAAFQNFERQKNECLTIVISSEPGRMEMPSPGTHSETQDT